VTVAYQTSGDLAVPDPEAQQAIEMIIDVASARGHTDEEKYGRQLEAELEAKGDFGFDSDNIRHLKGIIRRGEARSSSRTLGLETSQLRFLNLPFYQKGRYRRFSICNEDVDTMVNLLNEIRPHQVYATGHGHDPLSVPALCFDVLARALEKCRDKDWFKDCWIWLYRGPGAEWEAHDIDMAVPLSPGELDNKVQGIYQHQTQRSQQPGSSSQRSLNLWNLAREINSGTAAVYDSLGLAEYEAIECFKRFEIQDEIE
jgi:glucosamine-6-phosphate deaminase